MGNNGQQGATRGNKGLKWAKGVPRVLCSTAALVQVKYCKLEVVLNG